MNNKTNLLKVGDTSHHFSKQNLPTLLHYKKQEGGSHYSMVLLENLALQGEKILLLTGYPEAKEQFYNDTKKIVQQTVVVNNLDEVEKNKDKQVIVIHDDDEKLCLDAIKTLEDINERIIFIKNIDIFHQPLFTEAMKHEKIIISGEIDDCPAIDDILEKQRNTIILFSQPKIELPYTFVPTEKYTGYIRSKNKEGYVRSAV